jgi:hypothetical protein
MKLNNCFREHSDVPFIDTYEMKVTFEVWRKNVLPQRTRHENNTVPSERNKK